MNKNAIALLLILSASVSSVHGADAAPPPVLLNKETIAFAYEAKSKQPGSMDDLAFYISTVRPNKVPWHNEFERRAQLEQMKPEITRDIEAARRTALWQIKFSASLPEYDFKRHGYATSLTPTTYVPVSGNLYGVEFPNVRQFMFVPVEAAAAQKAAASIPVSRSVTIEIEGAITDVQPKEVGYYYFKMVALQISHLAIRAPDGTLLGELN